MSCLVIEKNHRIRFVKQFIVPSIRVPDTVACDGYVVSFPYWPRELGRCPQTDSLCRSETSSGMYLKNCIFGRVLKCESNKLVGAETVVFENVMINNKRIVQSVEQEL